MLSKELAMEESISICRDYNIDIDTAMELVLESSLYDFEEDVAMESLLGKSMRLGPRILSGLKRVCSFIANAIRSIIAKLTKNNSKRKVELEKIDKSIGGYIKRSAEMITGDITKMCEKCDKCIKDMLKTIKSANDTIDNDRDDLKWTEPSIDLSYTFDNTPSEIKRDVEDIYERFEYLRSYCSKMETKYREGKTMIVFVGASISDIIDKRTSDKLERTLGTLNTDVKMLAQILESFSNGASKLNKAETNDIKQSPHDASEARKQIEFLEKWNKKSSEYVNTIAASISKINSIFGSDGLRVPHAFNNENTKARNNTSSIK